MEQRALEALDEDAQLVLLQRHAVIGLAREGTFSTFAIGLAASSPFCRPY
jgi:hypothetical protein